MSEVTLSEIEQIMHECMLNRYSESSSATKKIILNELIQLTGVDPSSTEDDLISVVSGKLPLNIEGIVTATLWRLLQYHVTEWLHENPWRLVIINLIEQNYTEKLLDEKQNKSQAHEKIIILTEKLKEVEKAFFSAINHLTSLDRINPHREKMMRSIKNPLGQFVIMSFMPSDIEAKLGEVYKKVELYINNYNTNDVVIHFDKAFVTIDLLITQLADYHNLYCLTLSEMLQKKLKCFLMDHFSNSPAGKPSFLCIRHDEKKYPLDCAGNVLTISFNVKNEGPGYASQIEFNIISNSDLKIKNPYIQLGALDPYQSQQIDIFADIVNPVHPCEIFIEAKWSTFNNDDCNECMSLTLSPQRPDIPWDELKITDPYSLEAVLTEEDLVGRKEVLNRLTANCQNTVNSSIIKGQKRVGKTSIARALQSRLIAEGFIAIYLEGGDYVEPTPTGTLSRLGKKICREISNKEPRVKHIPQPAFTDALSPLVDYLDDIQQVTPEKRIVIILDEFDELPLDLYFRGPLGDAFFLTLRSISSKKNIGFIVVGGERMVQIIDCQGDQLNKWQSFDVDYFDKETHWGDYKELIQRPVVDVIEFTEEAYEHLHEYTFGNPFFTKVICRRIFENAVKSRDGYIRSREVLSAISTVANECDRNTFQHFWEDRILDTGEKAAEKSIRRRKVLISVSDLVEKQEKANIQNLMHHDLIKDVPSFEADLKEFESRNILVSQNEEYDFKVKLFKLWLKGRGVGEIISTFVDLDALLRIKQAEENFKIKPSEIVALKSKFGMYKGQSVSEDKIRCWLDQFHNPKEQRLMFRILDSCIFYSAASCRSKLLEAHSIVKSRVVHVVEEGKQKRSDLIVSYYDHIGKSSAGYARMYADEASIYVDNVVEKGELIDVILTRSDIKALVFIDDIVGTGNSAIDFLTSIDSTLYPYLIEKNIQVFFIAIAGFTDGIKKVQDGLTKLNSEIRFHVCDTYDETFKSFSSKSKVFIDPSEREHAKTVAHRFGKILEKKWPLGYGDLEAAIAFENSCPNNSLPILWAEGKGSLKWLPLFKRL